jgi:hypothetical protein
VIACTGISQRGRETVRPTLVPPVLQCSLVELIVLGGDIDSGRMGVEAQEAGAATVGEGCAVWSARAVHREEYVEVFLEYQILLMKPVYMLRQ